MNLHSLKEFDYVCHETKNNAEIILRKTEYSHFLQMLKIGKTKKFHPKCHSVENTFWFPNLLTRAQKQMIRQKKKTIYKISKFGKIAFFDKIGMKPGMKRQGEELYKVYMNHWPGVTLSYLMTRSA